MKVISFFESDRQEHWLSAIKRSDWKAGAFLYELLSRGTFFEAVGEGSKVLLLTDGDELISYCTYAKKDDIQPTELSPWMGFVYTFPKHRGHRYVGLLFEEIEHLAKKEQVSEVYISTNHIGLYEKYSCEYLTQMNDMDGEPSRVYVKKIEFNSNEITNKTMEQKFCQSCGMPLTDQVLGTNANGSKNEDYCIYCYKDGAFTRDCAMDEMIEFCAQFVDEVNKGLPQPITKEEYIGQMKMYFPHLKRWRQTMKVSDDMPENPALAPVKSLIAKMADTLPITYISSVDEEGFPCTKAMLSPRVREGIKVFYFTTNTFSLRVAHYKVNPKACIYFSDNEGFKGMMLRGTMEVLTDAKSKEMIWREGDEQYYPGGVTDPNYCVLKFTATDGRFYSDFYPRSFVL